MQIQTDSIRIKQLLSDLCSMGPRWPGTEGEKKALDYITGYLQGLDVPYFKEEFNYTSFSVEKAELRVVEEPIKIECQALGYSGSGTVEGELVYVNECELGQVDLSHKIVLSDALKSYQAYPKACQSGAKGFILGNNLPGNILRVGVTNYDRQIGSIPGVTIGAEDTQKLLSIANKGKKVFLQVEAKTVEEIGFNLVANTGKNADAPKIVVCSHYDSMWLGQHAFDNASGTAAILELIRCFKGLPDLNLEFLVCGAEELGFWGSKAYVARHMAKCQDISCVVCLDGICSDLGTVEIGVTEDIVQLVKQFAAEKEFQVDKWSIPPRPNSDHVAFDSLNKPVFWITSMDPFYHTSLDVIDNVSVWKLKANTDFAAGMILSLLEYL
jgi:Zn-dependent M28 family amino/carboxypeptidase